MNRGFGKAPGQALARLPAVCSNVHDDLWFHATGDEDIIRVLDPIEPKDGTIFAFLTSLHARGQQQLVEEFDEGHRMGGVKRLPGRGLVTVLR